MKKIIIILFFFIRIFSFAQLSVDVGLDTTFCSGLFLNNPDTIFIGERVSVFGGTKPYSFYWSCKVQLSNRSLHASDFLNDTSLLNPYFIDVYFNNEWITFKLKVVDSMGNSAIDSLCIRFSSFGYSLQYYKMEIDEGDSISFLGIPFINGGIQPLFYSWYPSVFLSDSTDLAAYARPDSSIEYNLYAIDSLGCKSDTVPFYNIKVNKASIIEDIDNNIDEFTLIACENEIKVLINNSSIRSNKKDIYIHTLDGKKLLLDSFSGLEYTFSKSKIKSEIIIVSIIVDNLVLFRSKVFLF